MNINQLQKNPKKVESCLKNNDFKKIIAQINQENFYDRLGLSQSASLAEIRKQYYELSRHVHPDRGKTKCEDYFKRINDAYECLSDPYLRREYDGRSDEETKSCDFDSEFMRNNINTLYESLSFTLDLDLFEIFLNDRELGIRKWNDLPLFEKSMPTNSGLEQYLDSVMSIYGFDQVDQRSHIVLNSSVLLSAMLPSVSVFHSNKKVCALIPLKLIDIQNIKVYSGTTSAINRYSCKKCLLPIFPVKHSQMILDALIVYLKTADN